MGRIVALEDQDTKYKTGLAGYNTDIERWSNLVKKNLSLFLFLSSDYILILLWQASMGIKNNLQKKKRILI